MCAGVTCPVHVGKHDVRALGMVLHALVFRCACTTCTVEK